MILLDTDIVSLYHAGHERVTARIENVDPAEVLGTTVISLAEILRARFEFLLKAADGAQLQLAQQTGSIDPSGGNDMGALKPRAWRIANRRRLELIGKRPPSN